MKTKAEKAAGLLESFQRMLVRYNDKQVEMTQQSVAAGLDGAPDVVKHRSAVHALGDRVLVSVVVPTMPSRRWAHRSIYECFCHQTWPSKELLVLETGGNTCASPFWRDVAREDERVVYKYEARDVLLGPKRNRFLAMAEGAVIAQFDDDDIYGDEYLDRMVAALLGDCLDDRDCADDGVLAALLAAPRLAQLASWVGYDVASSTILLYDAAADKAADERGAADRLAEGKAAQGFGWHSRYYGYGFSYVFTLAYQRRSPFPDNMHLHQDYVFVCAGAARAQAHFVCFDDDLERPIVVHIRHEGSSTDNPAIRHIETPPRGFPIHQLAALLADAPQTERQEDPLDVAAAPPPPAVPGAVTVRSLAAQALADDSDY